MSHQRSQAGGDSLAGPVASSPARMAAASPASSAKPSRPARRARAESSVSSSSRSTMRNALAATLAWKLTWPLVACRTSVSRNSATAATNSAAVGRPCNVSSDRACAGSAGGTWLASSRSSRSHSVSQTRRPIVGQLHRAGLSAQMALGLVSADDAPAQRGQHQPPVKRLPVDGGPAGLLVVAAGNSRCCPAPRRPGLAGAPNRQARMQNHARSSYGSPTCTSSQSSTAARSDPSTIRFPIRKSPCTRTGGDGGGRWAASQRNAHSKVAVVSPMASSRSRHSASWSSRARAGSPASARWMAASACAHWRSRLARPASAASS